MRSNIAEWTELHRGGYFSTHPRYKNRTAACAADLEHLAQFGVKLHPGMTIAVIGSGYGREVALFAPLVEYVWAIDVCIEAFVLMREYLEGKNILNVQGVIAPSWRQDVEPGVDLFYSMATFQHMTKDLARDYLAGIADKLKPVSGRAVIQFAENETGTADAELKVYEPNVRWTEAEIRAAVKNAGLKTLEINTLQGTNKMGRKWAWHWAFIGPAAPAKEE